MAKSRSPKQLTTKIKSLKRQITRLERARKKAIKRRKYYSKKKRRG
jgi:hypothetical protein